MDGGYLRNSLKRNPEVKLYSIFLNIEKQYCNYGKDCKIKFLLFSLQVMAQLQDLTNGMSWTYQNIIRKVQDLIFTALFVDNHHEKNNHALRVTEHHAKLRKLTSPPSSVVEGVDDIRARTGREAVDSFSGGRPASHPFVLVCNFTQF